MIKDTIEKVNLHRLRAKQAADEIVGFKDKLNVDVFNDFEKVKTIDTFIYRFIKLQDMMGDKLFRIFLDEIGEYKDSMSLLDVLDKLEKLELVEDASRWMLYRKLRNKLTHEYPSNEQEIVEGIEMALDVFSDIDNILEKIISYSKSHSLI
jgi:uncharacterized protein YutE (UPF0331/DUF86 family)